MFAYAAAAVATATQIEILFTLEVTKISFFATIYIHLFCFYCNLMVVYLSVMAFTTVHSARAIVKCFVIMCWIDATTETWICLNKIPMSKKLLSKFEKTTEKTSYQSSIGNVQTQCLNKPNISNVGTALYTTMYSNQTRFPPLWRFIFVVHSANDQNEQMNERTKRKSSQSICYANEVV